MSDDDAPTRALRERSPEILLDGLRRLLATTAMPDSRDLMLSLAPYHDCAQRLGLDPAAVFDEASATAAPSVRELARQFGRRTDIRGRSFAYRVEKTPQGPRYTTSGW